jgi:hypothetical protein
LLQNGVARVIQRATSTARFLISRRWSAFAIFDGHTRYNLSLAFARIGMAHPKEGYQGQVVVCSAKFLPVAGYDPKHFLVTYLAAQHETEIWLAPLIGTRLLVPYWASISTPMGVGILEATKIAFVPSEENAREGH